MAIKKLCPKCQAIINYTDGYCSKCAKKIQEQKEAYFKRNRSRYDKAYNAKREKKLQMFYSSIEWHRLRNQMMLKANYLCQDCLKDKMITAAEEVHHIVPIKNDWSLRLSEDNLVCLCTKCHKARHKELNKK